MRDFRRLMERRRWRWLWIWVGVLVAGCGQLWSSESPPAATRAPTLPLWGYTLLPPSLTPSLWSVYTATPLVAIDSATLNAPPVAFYLRVTGAACYPTPLGSLICLGLIRNLNPAPVEQVSVAVQLLDRNGAPLAVGETWVSRWMIPAGAVGPYRILFDHLPEGYASAFSYAQSGQLAPEADRRYGNLALQEVSGAFVVDQYQVTVSVINISPVAVERITVTMTLLDEFGQVTGFRQMPLDPQRRLEPGESLALTMKVIPQGPNTVSFDAFAEGLLAVGN
jgi:hypothetical protein